MKQVWLTMGCLVCITGVMAQSPHVSAANIQADKEQVTVVLNSFWENWETTYFHHHKEEVDFSDPGTSRIPWFDQYLTSHFYLSLSEQGKPLDLQIDSITVDGPSMTIRMEAGLPAQADSLYIYNNLLTHVFPDQKNLVIFSNGKGESGIEFDIEKIRHAVPLK